MNAIEAELVAAFPRLRPLRLSGRRSAWWLLLDADNGPRAGLRLDGAWATLRMDAKCMHAADPLGAITEHMVWPGSVKHADRGSKPMLRADVPLLEATAAGRAWVIAQLRAATEGMAIAAGIDMPREDSPQPPPQTDPELIAYACVAHGWSNAAVKPDGSVRIDVVLRGAMRSVVLAPDTAGVRVSTTIATDTLVRARAPSRTALGILLRRASTALRWARPFVSRQNDDLESAGFDCFVAGSPDEAALLLAVDAAIAGGELFGREIEVLLEHPDVAALYCEHMLGASRDVRKGVSSAGMAASRPPAPLPAACAVGI